jgi:hypothetical protein
LDRQTKDIPMAATQLKRAERAIERIREHAELPSETATALQELVDVVESRLAALEGRGRIHPTAEMSLPNRR